MKRLLALAILIVALAGLADGQTRTNVNTIRYINMNGRSLALPLLAGDMWRNNDTIFTYMGPGDTLKELISRPGDGQVKVWDSVKSLWKYGNAGVGGTNRWNEILNPNGNITPSIGTYLYWLTASTTPGDAPSFWWVGQSNIHAGFLALFSTSDGGSMTKPWGAYARGTANGVYVDHLGNLKYDGAGTISANRWKGLTTIDKASQYAQTAYYDQLGTFLYPVDFQKDTAGWSALASNEFNSSTAIGFLGNASYGRGVQGQSLFGIGVYGKSQLGPGGVFGSTSGNMLELFYGPAFTTRLTFTNSAIVPGAGMDLGTAANPIDSVFANYIVNTSDRAGKATFPANDTILVYGISGIDSNYVVMVNFIDRSPMVASLSGKAYQDGHIEITSSSSPMIGRRVSWFAKRVTQ